MYVCMYVWVYVLYVYIYIQRGSEIFLGIQGAYLRTSYVSFLCVCARVSCACARVCLCHPLSLYLTPHIPCVCFLCVCVCVCVSVCEIPYVSFLHAHHTTSANMARRPGDHSFRQSTDLRIASVSALQNIYVSLSIYLSIFYLNMDSMPVASALDDLCLSLSLSLYLLSIYLSIGIIAAVSALDAIMSPPPPLSHRCVLSLSHRCVLSHSHRCVLWAQLELRGISGCWHAWRKWQRQTRTRMCDRRG
jgi:hypothetical protein